VGLTDGGGALSADGVIIATRAISSELPIRNRPILFIIFSPVCAFDLKVLAAANGDHRQN
jgi:hypothetical protein